MAKVRTQSILLSCSFIVATVIVLLLGGARALHISIVQEELLFRAVSFRVWDSLPFSNHGFLTFLSEQNFIRGEPYLNMAPPALLLSYVPMKLLSLIGVS